MTSSAGFTKRGKDTFVATFGETEREVLINLTEQLIEILAERVDEVDGDPLAAMVGITGHDSPPDDQVLLRLLPDAYADAVESAEFRRYTESVLRDKKRTHALVIRTHLLTAKSPKVELDRETAKAWLGALNDIRLALGVRLQIDADSSERFGILPTDDPTRGVYSVYSWLSWLQESLLHALMDQDNRKQS
jgi:hypothetical protein